MLVVKLSIFGGLLCLGAFLFLSNAAIFLAFVLCSVGILLTCIDPFYGLGMLLLVLPIHTFMLNLLKMFAGVSSPALLALATWKEIVLGAVVFIAFLRRKRRAREPQIMRELAAALGLIALGVPFIFIGPTIGSGLYGFRNLFEGIVILVVMLQLAPQPERRLMRLIELLIVEAVGISIWGVLQIYLYPYRYLTDLGFEDPKVFMSIQESASVYRASGIALQRANSILVGPNELGLILAVLGVFVLILLSDTSALRRSQRKFLYGALVAMLICEFYTFSRVAWIFTIVAALGALSDVGRIRRAIGLCLFLLVIATPLVYLVPSVEEYIVKTYYIKDPSSATHYFSLLRAVERLKENPLGYGLGTAGYKSGGYTGLGNEIFNREVESFLMLVALEMGLFGLMAYLGFLGYLLMTVQRGFKGPRRSDVAWHVHAKWMMVGTVVAGMLSVIPYDLLFQFYLWFFVGAALNFKSVRQASRIPCATSSDRVTLGTVT
jgi:hypothetical protein